MYAFRWQLSGIILAPVIAIIDNPVLAVILGNLLGAIVFFPVDKYGIFKDRL